MWDMAGGRTETATFRFEPKTLASLKQEAKIKNITLNSLVNSVISQYLDWFSDTRNTNHVHLWKLIPVKLLAKYSNDEIRSIARAVCETEMKHTLITLKEKYAIIPFFESLQSWLKASNFVYRYEVDGTKHKFVIQFNMSRKWSLFLAEIFKYICNELNVACKFGIEEKILIFETDVKGA